MCPVGIIRQYENPGRNYWRRPRWLIPGASAASRWDRRNYCRIPRPSRRRETVRAGVLEHWVVELMKDLGLGERMLREGHFHEGITLQWNRSAITSTFKD